MTEPKKWTVMVWMAGDNNLEDFGGLDLKEMKQVGSNDDLNIVVQFDRMSDQNTRRYYVQQGTSSEADVVQELGPTNTGDPAVATGFFAWGIETYPAEHYLAVLWNHGSGIDETDIYKTVSARGFQVRRKVQKSSTEIPRSHVRSVVSRRYRQSLFSTTIDNALSFRAIALDDTARDFLDNIELKRVFTSLKRKTRRKIDVIGFDACLMNMMEIAYQLKDQGNLSVGSEETEPGDGWPYDRVLRDLAADPTMTPQQLGAVIVKRYAESYTGESVTLSALDLGRSTAMAQAVDKLALALTKAIKDPTEYAAVTKAVRAAQSYELKDFIDLYSLCEQFKKKCKTKEVKDCAQATMTALTAGTEKFVAAEKHKGSAMKNSHGVSIYFPRGDVTVVHPRLDFAKKTHWDEFINAYSSQ